MKYIKKAYSLVNRRPQILLFYLPIILINILVSYGVNSSGNNIISTILQIVSPLLLIAMSVLILPIISKIVFVSRHSDSETLAINIKQTIGHGIPRYLLYMVVVWISTMGLFLLLSISIVPAILSIALLVSAAQTFSVVLIVIFALDIIGKLVLMILLLIATAIYPQVYLLFMNMDISISSLIKSSFVYTYHNYRKLLGIVFVTSILPTIILLGSNYLYNFIVGIPMVSIVFFGSWIYIVIMIAMQLLSILSITAVILTWNDEANKDKYLEKK